MGVQAGEKGGVRAISKRCYETWISHTVGQESNAAFV